MSDLDENLNLLYQEFVNREVYKSKVNLKSLSYTPKIIFLDNPVRETYWFPSYTGSITELYKMADLKVKPVYETFFLNNISFINLFKIYLESQLNLNVDDLINSKSFKRNLVLINESVRKQTIKQLLPPTRLGRFNLWRHSKVISKYNYLNYFFDYSPHRTASKFRKFNYISFNNWGFNRNWLFSYPKMKRWWLKAFAVERFQWKFHRFEGMSFAYWAEKQLEHNYYNVNSFDLTSDVYSSRQFIIDYPPLTKSEILNEISLAGVYQHSLFFYWTLKHSIKKTIPLSSYFAFSYPTNQYTYGAKYLYVKNFYASLSPSYSQAYYNIFRDENFVSLYPKFRWYMFTEGPTYWNLKKGFNKHPHEFWSWESVSWWEDDVYLRFFRFTKKRRRAKFKIVSQIDPLGYYNVDSFWFYKTWIHENIFLELVSSYYKSYFNFKYLDSESVYYTEYPIRKKGHFDPKWQDRLNQYTYSWNPDYILPSTQQFYENYSSIDKNFVRVNSFIALNFSWRFGKEFFFLPYHKRSFLNKNLNYLDNLKDAVYKFSPKFYNNLNFGCDFVLPLTFSKDLNFLTQISSFSDNLIFLINLLYSLDQKVELTLKKKLFLFYFIKTLSITSLEKDFFLKSLLNFKGLTYLDLNIFINENFNIINHDLLSSRERVVAEYVAFKRMYVLIISKHIVFK